jgi:hypothetical protein
VSGVGSSTVTAQLLRKQRPRTVRVAAIVAVAVVTCVFMVLLFWMLALVF